MSLRQLKWWTILAPLAFLAVLEFVRAVIFADQFEGWPGYLLLAGVVLVGVLFFSEAVFSVIDRIQGRLAKRNRELLALHEAGLDIAGDLELETVLQRVVDEARLLIGARYGALSYLSEDGGIEAFLTSGISPEQREAIGPPPIGHGLLAVVLRKGERLRLDDLTTDPRSTGFPPHHPEMHSLLAVPIVARGHILGNLYLTEKEAGVAFDPDDEETLERFATQAALAMENARLHRQVRALAVSEERERIAREIHDSVAQVLGYVNTKAQAAEELLRSGEQERAVRHIEQLGQAARDAYADVREHILGLRASSEFSHGLLPTLRTYIERWQDGSGIAVELVVEPHDAALRLSTTAELQLLRIIQEALANVRKHASANQARVRLADIGEWVEVCVEDNGAGFDPDAMDRSVYPRFGLSTMRERAEAAGGMLTIEAAPGRGTRVVARIPEEQSLATVAENRRSG